MSDTSEIFGEPVYTYTRRQALEDGFQIDVSSTAREAGIKFPLFLTRGVWDAYVAIPEGVTCQDEAGRLWDVVWMTRFAILRAPSDTPRMPVELYVRNTNGRARRVRLVAVCGAYDIDDPRPVITVMLPEED